MVVIKKYVNFYADSKMLNLIWYLFYCVLLGPVSRDFLPNEILQHFTINPAYPPGVYAARHEGFERGTAGSFTSNNNTI